MRFIDCWYVYHRFFLPLLADPANHLSSLAKKTRVFFYVVSPLPGKTAGEEVMVQGKQLVAVKEYLTDIQGVPKRWVETNDATVKKKK